MPPKSEGGPDDGRIPGVLHDGQGIVHGPGEAAVGNGQADPVHGLSELLPVLGHLDGPGIGPDELDPVFLQEPPPMELHGQVEGGLAAHGGEEGVGLFSLDDPLHPGRRQGLDVGPVRQVRIGHDGGRIGVHQDDPVPLFLEGPDSLGTGIVELAGLANDDGARAEDQNGVEIGAFGHGRPDGSSHG